MESSWPSLRRGPGALSRCPPPRRCHRGPCPPVWGLRSVSCPRRGWRGEAHTRTSGGAACPPASGPASPWSLASTGLTWPHGSLSSSSSLCPLTTRLLCVNTRHQLMACDVWWHWEGQLGPAADRCSL